jgi:hypothetical protein
MSLLPFCRWLAETPGSIALRESLYMYPLVESAHVLTLTLFLGMAIMFDLRLLGVTLTSVPMTEIRNRLGPWMAGGFVLMVTTGALLFYAIPVRSYQSLWFRRVAEWDRQRVPPLAARRAAAASLMLWAVVVVTGRMIAYKWFDCDKQPQPRIVNVLAGCVVPAPGPRR